MAEQTSRNKVNIGLSSLILIFIVLCLSTFGLLSLSSARGDLELAERGAQAAKEFYEADSKGQQWLAGSDRMLQQMACLLYTSPSPRDGLLSRMPSSA